MKLTEQYLEEMVVNNVSLRHVSKPHEMSNYPIVDLIYSIIVLQPNPPPNISLILKESLKALNPGKLLIFKYQLTEWVIDLFYRSI